MIENIKSVPSIFHKILFLERMPLKNYIEKYFEL